MEVNSRGALAGCSAEDNLNSGVLPSISAVISVAFKAKAGVVNSMNPKLYELEDRGCERKKGSAKKSREREREKKKS